MLKSVVFFIAICSSCLVACTHRNVITTINTKDSATIFSSFDSAISIQGSNPDSAYVLLQSVGILSKKLDYGNGIMNYYNYAVYNRCAFKGDFESGNILSDSAVAYAAMPNHEAYKTAANFTKAVYYQTQEIHDSAIHYYLESLKYQYLTSDSSKLEPTYNNLAILLNYQGRFTQAIEYQKKSLSLYSSTDTNSLIGYYNNMYRHYIGAKDTANAINCFHSGMALSKMKKQYPSENELLNIAGDYYLMMNQPDSAIYFYHQHLEYTAKLYDSIYLSQPYVSLAKAYWADSNFNEAAVYLKKVAALIDPQELPLYSRKDYYTTAYQYAVKNGNTLSALQVLQRLNDVNENFIIKQRNNDIVNYDRQMKELEKEKAQLASTLKIKRKNTWIILLAMGCLLILSIGIIATLYWRKKKVATAAALSKLELETEWKQLSSRMQAQEEERNRISQELHDDLGATLTSISLAAAILQDNYHSQEVEMIARSSSDMTTRMNEIVWSLNADNDNLQSLSAYIRKFCNTFLKDAGIDVVYTEDIANPTVEIKGSIRRNVFHTVKEAVNNIVKHAKASKVTINIKTDADNFFISIADNGMGMKDAKANTWNNGLRNMQKNIESIKGTIEWMFKEGTEISIITPLKL